MELTQSATGDSGDNKPGLEKKNTVNKKRARELRKRIANYEVICKLVTQRRGAEELVRADKKITR